MITINISSSNQITRPWYGFGIEWDVFDNDTGTPITLTSAQSATLFARLDFLRLTIVRCVLGEIGWYCPTGVAGTYTWNSAEMQAVKSILNYCQNRGITVIMGFFQPAPFALTDSAIPQVTADLYSYLLKQGYSCIRFHHEQNEPDLVSGMTYATYKGIAQNVATAMTSSGNAQYIAQLGLDVAYQDAWDYSAATDLRSVLGGYDRHEYPQGQLDISSGAQETYFSSFVSNIQANDGSAIPKPILLTEMGYGYQSGPGDNQFQNSYFTYGLEMADYAIQVARAGMSAGIAWMLDDSMHNKHWGMMNVVSEANYRPWYYAWSLLSRAFPRGSVLLSPAMPTSDLRVLAAKTSALGTYSYAMVNRNASAQAVKLTMSSVQQVTINEYLYSVASMTVDGNGLPRPTSTLTINPASGAIINVPGNSLVVLQSADHPFSFVPISVRKIGSLHPNFMVDNQGNMTIAD